MRQQHKLPALGERFGSRIVVGHTTAFYKGKTPTWIVVQCACERGPPYKMLPTNLRAKPLHWCRLCSPQINATARYREIVPNESVRKSLLSRITSIYQRCYDPERDHYHSYGARGIRCWWYEQYNGATDTYTWRVKMLEHIATLDGHDIRSNELDRTDNDKGYEPGNLRFVTFRQNLSNRRTVRDLQQRVDELESVIRVERRRDKSNPVILIQ
jgi:hypothetical protein